MSKEEVNTSCILSTEEIVSRLSMPSNERKMDQMRLVLQQLLKKSILLQKIQQVICCEDQLINSQKDEDLIQALISSSIETFNQGSFIFQIKEKAEKMYIILEGTIEVSIPPKQLELIDETIVAKTITEGSVLGDIDLFLNTSRSHIAIAKKKTICLVIKKASFDTLLKENYSILFTETMNYVFNLKIFENISGKFMFIKAFFDTFTSPLSFSQGQQVFNERNSPDNIYFIITGSFLILKSPSPIEKITQNTQESFYSIEELNLNQQRGAPHYVKICELQRGSFFGEEDIIENKKTRSFKVVCNSSTGGELYSIRREIFERIFMKHFSIEQYFLKNLPTKQILSANQLALHSKLSKSGQITQQGSKKQIQFSFDQRQLTFPSNQQIPLPQQCEANQRINSDQFYQTSSNNYIKMSSNTQINISSHKLITLSSNTNIKTISHNFIPLSTAHEKSNLLKREREDLMIYDINEDEQSINYLPNADGIYQNHNSQYESSNQISFYNSKPSGHSNAEPTEFNRIKNSKSISAINLNINTQNQEMKTTLQSEETTKRARKSAQYRRLGTVNDLLEFAHSSLNMLQHSSTLSPNHQIQKRISSDDMCAVLENEHDKSIRAKKTIMNIEKQMKETFEFDMNAYIKNKSSSKKTVQNGIQNIQNKKKGGKRYAGSAEVDAKKINYKVHKKMGSTECAELMLQSDVSRNFQNTLRKMCFQYGRSDMLQLKKSLKKHIKDNNFKKILNANFKNVKDHPIIQWTDNSRVSNALADKIKFLKDQEKEQFLFHQQPEVSNLDPQNQQSNEKDQLSSEKFHLYTNNQPSFQPSHDKRIYSSTSPSSKSLKIFNQESLKKIKAIKQTNLTQIKNQEQGKNENTCQSQKSLDSFGNLFPSQDLLPMYSQSPPGKQQESEQIQKNFSQQPHHKIIALDHSNQEPHIQLISTPTSTTNLIEFYQSSGICQTQTNSIPTEQDQEYLLKTFHNSPSKKSLWQQNNNSPSLNEIQREFRNDIHSSFGRENEKFIFCTHPEEIEEIRTQHNETTPLISNQQINLQHGQQCNRLLFNQKLNNKSSNQCIQNLANEINQGKLYKGISHSYTSYPVNSVGEQPLPHQKTQIQSHSPSFSKLKNVKQINQREKFEEFKQKKNIIASINMKKSQLFNLSLIKSPLQNNNPETPPIPKFTFSSEKTQSEQGKNIIRSQSAQKYQSCNHSVKASFQSQDNTNQQQSQTRTPFSPFRQLKHSSQSEKQSFSLKQNKSLNFSPYSNKKILTQIAKENYETEKFPTESIHTGQPEKLDFLSPQTITDSLQNRSPSQKNLQKIQKQLQLVVNSVEQPNNFFYTNQSNNDQNNNNYNIKRQIQSQPSVSLNSREDRFRSRQTISTRKEVKGEWEGQYQNNTSNTCAATFVTGNPGTLSFFNSTSSHRNSQINLQENLYDSILIQKTKVGIYKKSHLLTNSIHCDKSYQIQQPTIIKHSELDKSQEGGAFTKFKTDEKIVQGLGMKIEQLIQSSISAAVPKQSLAVQKYAPLHRKALSLFKS